MQDVHGQKTSKFTSLFPSDQRVGDGHRHGEYDVSDWQSLRRAEIYLNTTVN